VLGDPDRLQQVLCNLLSNAIKFSPQGAAIRVEAAARGEAVEIVVRDRGIGISPDFLPFLFDRFRQEDSSSHRTHGGLGLGLAIVRHLVQLHGGQVEARSPGTGRGAAFIVRLPLQQDRSLDAIRPGIVGTALEPISLSGLRIVAVDDDPDARDLLERMLRRAGAEVRITARPDEARGLVRTWRPHVLLSDLEMPGEDGFALVRRLRADGFAALPAIAVTAYAGPENRMQAIESGFQAHISKPLDQRQLERVIAAAARWRPESA